MRSKYYPTTFSFLLTICLIALFATSPVRIAGQERTDQKRAVVWAVFSFVGASLNPSIEPFVLMDGGEYKTPVAGDSTAEELSEFASSYYRPGQKYRLLSGGGEAGSVIVQKDTKDEECARSGAKVKLQTKVALNRNVMALATNSDVLGRAPSSRRPPTPVERAAALRLAKQIYLQRGVSAALLQNLETVNLTASDLDRDGKAELIGTYVVKKEKGAAARYVLFVLAEPQGRDYRSGVTNYQRYTNEDVMSGGDIDSIGADGIYTERFVDQLDLDGDDVAEVITITNGFEGDTYHIYKKQPGKWQSVYEFAKYRCAF